jgi:hypothetical protein
MGRKEKLYQKAKNSPKNLHFDELCSLAKSVGFEKRKLKRRTRGSSHIIFKHPALNGMMNFQKGKDGKAIPYQVRQLLEFIAANHLIDENVEQ